MVEGCLVLDDLDGHWGIWSNIRRALHNLPKRALPQDALHCVPAAMPHTRLSDAVTA